MLSLKIIKRMSVVFFGSDYKEFYLLQIAIFNSKLFRIVKIYIDFKIVKCYLFN